MSNTNMTDNNDGGGGGVMEDSTNKDNEFQWTPVTILQSVALFGLAGVAEILGGWMVWMLSLIHI